MHRNPPLPLFPRSCWSRCAACRGTRSEGRSSFEDFEDGFWMDSMVPRVFSYAGLIELDVHNCKAWEAWMHQLKVSLPIWPEVGQFCLGADLEPASWQWTGNYSFSLIKVYESEFVCERRQSMRKYVQHSATFRSYSWTGFMDWFTEMVNQVLPQPEKSLTTAGYPLVCST